ncbi:hypothetical protein Tco_0308936 [Tanacetum coccineum]
MLRNFYEFIPRNKSLLRIKILNDVIGTSGYLCGVLTFFNGGKEFEQGMGSKITNVVVDPAVDVQAIASLFERKFEINAGDFSLFSRHG